MSFLSLAKALLTLCCLHRSLVFVKIFLVMSRFLFVASELRRSPSTTFLSPGAIAAEAHLTRVPRSLIALDVSALSVQSAACL